MNRTATAPGASRGPNCLLLVVAAPKEAQAVARGVGVVLDASGSLPAWEARPVASGIDLLITGVGKANAAAGVARALDPSRHARLVNLGIAGSLPGSGLAIGDVVEADRCSLADEGSQNPDGFVSIADMGFGPLLGICGAGSGLESIHIGSQRLLPEGSVRRGGVATVSVCSGTDAGAVVVRDRTGAIVEDMESAAVGFTAARIAPGAGFSALKVVSNTTGDRMHQTWDVPRALVVLTELARMISIPSGKADRQSG